MEQVTLIDTDILIDIARNIDTAIAYLEALEQKPDSGHKQRDTDGIDGWLPKQARVEAANALPAKL